MPFVNIIPDSFYKFLTSLSLSLFIFSCSFNTIFIRPYNERVLKENIETANLTADEGYLKGVSLDLILILNDSIKSNGSLLYYNEDKAGDTSQVLRYYCTLGHSEQTKRLVDSLNLVNKSLARTSFTLKSY
jgi:hypothetical protein